MVYRQPPCPGPIRCLGKVTASGSNPRNFDPVIDEINQGLYARCGSRSRYPTPLETVRMGDYRTYANVVAVRVVWPER